MTLSQVPTQPQRINDTPTVRIQPVATTPEPAWPTTEPMTATNLTPVALTPTAVTTNGTSNGTSNGVANGAFSGRINGTIAAPTQPAHTNGTPAAVIPAADRPEPAALAAKVPEVVTAPAAAPAAPVVEFADAPAPTAAKPTPPVAAPAEPATPRSKLRRIARRIVGPTLLTKRN